jgi:hypothetical protein
MFDTDGDGYLDRWETYRTGSFRPVRVSTAIDPGVRELPQDWDELQQVYTRGMLPEALQANKTLTAAMRPLDEEFAAAEHLLEALKAASCDSERLYVQDIIRESQYLALRDELTKRSGELFVSASPGAWAFARAVSKLDAAYGEGRYDDAAGLLGQLARWSPGAAKPPVGAAPVDVSPPTGPAVKVQVEEFPATGSAKPEFYYCRADGRVHRRGAVDARIRFSGPTSGQPWGEIRCFDTDADGYFDRWETYLPGNWTPARVSTAADPGVRGLPADNAERQRRCREELIPAALAANEKLMAAMRLLDDFQVPQPLAGALDKAASDREKLDVQGLVRERQYLALRDKLAKRSGELFSTIAGKDARRVQTAMATSARAWSLAVATSKLDAAYGEGRYDDAGRLLGELAKLAAEQDED